MHEAQTSPELTDLEVSREFWNGWIAECLGGDTLDHASQRRGDTVMRLIRSLKLSHADILEVGCATGWLSVLLTEFGQVTGVDLADQPIAVAQKRYPQVNFIQGDFLKLHLPVEHFDIVVSVDVISYVLDQCAFIDKVFKVLKYGGYAILICPHKYIWDRTNFVRRSNGQIPLNWLNMGPFRALLSPRFSLLHIETIIPGGNRGYLRWINSRLLNAMARIIVPQAWLIRAKEKAGLGLSLVALVQK